jgi:CTP synthase
MFKLTESHVIGVHDVSNLYAVPLLLEQQQLSALLTTRLGLAVPAPELTAWRKLSSDADSLAQIPVSQEVRVAFVGKYIGLQDAYKSLIKALTHASIKCHVRLELVFVESSLLDGTDDAAAGAEAWAKVRSAHAVLVPGGFGVRGVEGKVAAVRYARENGVPFFGICLGLQVAVIEITRTVLGWQSNSEEFDDKSTHYHDAELRISRELFDGDAASASAAPPPRRNVIVFMPEVSKTHMGGTMRLGERRTIIHDPQCLSARLYGATDVFERHRHRYEVDPACVAEIESRTDLRFVGRDETGQRMEIAELPQSKHPFFVAVQFHPEFLSRPLRPAPLFVGFVQAAAARQKQQSQH